MTRGPLPGREPSQARRKLRNGKPLRRRGPSRPGRGRAEGQGRAIPCSPPAPGSLCSTRPCAPIRPPSARCAAAWRFRAPPPQPRSCGSTQTLRLCAICASPWATRSGPPRPWRRYGAIPPAGRRASTQAGSATPRRGRLRVLRLPRRLNRRSRNLCAMGVRHRPRHPAALAAAHAADRDENPRPVLAIPGRSRSPPLLLWISPLIYPVARTPCSPSRPSCAPNRR